MNYVVTKLKGGLGNQKMQLFGAVILAKMHGASLVEPRWRDWDWNHSQCQHSGGFGELYDFDHFAKTVKRVFNVEALSRKELRMLIAKREVKRCDLLYVNAQQSWNVWLWFEQEMLRNGNIYNFLLNFLNSFILIEPHQRLLNILLDSLNQSAPENAWHALHMRTEKDWFVYSQYKRSQIDLRTEEEVYLSPSIVRNKFYATFGNGNSHGRPQVVFLACDENSQQEDPFNIWSPNIRVFHKKDMAELRGCDNKTKSAIDFEICVESPVLAGTSRSSFLRLAALTRFARERDISLRTGGWKLPTFIYNLKSSTMTRRTDNGLYFTAAECVQKSSSFCNGDLQAIIKDLFWHFKWKGLVLRSRKLIKLGIRKCSFLC